MSKCIGCGVKLQNTNKELKGYINDLNNKYCARCFKTIHYNENIKVDNLNNIDIIKKINKLKYYTIFITDLLSLNQELIDIYKEINNQKILVINKSDLIPSNLILNHLQDNLKKIYLIEEDIIFISAKDNFNLNIITNIINKYQNIIICGETSSGKSTLINKISNSILTTSKYNNTTLDFIKIKYNNGYIYDSPGLIINSKKILNNKINVYAKKLNNNFIYSIDNLKISGLGNITIFIDGNITSKKEEVKLNYSYELNNQDILLNNGFIYVKKGIIKSNQELKIRNSIIK